ncbi:MAG: hypothetical protein CEE38_13245 [Planctomycetes bacterium B3_Pla]|nr:MAG: hypothetical protein CEE38_13245 [Planctomycetes bacterium B3_Pla]
MISFIILFSVIALLSLFYVYKSGGNYIQPHAFYSATVFILLVAIPVIQFFVVDVFNDVSGVILLNTMIGLSYVSFSIGFFTKKKKAVKILSGIVKGFNVSNPPKTILNLHILMMAFVAVALFISLTQKSGMGLLPWLSDPRHGYQYHRTGLGHLYVGSIAIFNFIFLYILFFKVRKVVHLIFATTIFTLVSYFYGSKGLVVFSIFEGIVYYNFFINKIKLRGVLIIFGLFVILFSFVFSLYGRQSTNVHLSNKILRYADYYNNARMFFSDFNEEFEYAYGREYLSGLWNYIPRAVYPNKPYSYGIVKYVVEKYHPGAGRSGHTPSFGGPVGTVEEYLNFGFAGVILVGFMRGYFSSLFYRYFLKYRNFLGFVLLSNLIGFSIFPIISGPLYKIIWYILNILLLLFHKQIVVHASAVQIEN